MSRFHRVAFGAFTAVVLVGLCASPAFAHVDPDPKEAPAGSEQSVGFTVQHGCDGSPTTQLDMRLPEGVTAAVPEAPDGWTGSVDGEVVTFVGGPLADDVELTFRVSMLLPLTPDATVYFPFVQRCEVGEIRWIDVPQDGSGEELDEPAPAMLLTAPLPGTTEPPTPTTVPATTSIETSTTSIEPSTTTTSTNSTATEVVPDASDETLPVTSSSLPALSEVPSEAPADDDGTGSSGTMVFIGVLLALAVVGTVATLQARRRR